MTSRAQIHCKVLLRLPRLRVSGAGVILFLSKSLHAPSSLPWEKMPTSKTQTLILIPLRTPPPPKPTSSSCQSHAQLSFQSPRFSHHQCLHSRSPQRSPGLGHQDRSHWPEPLAPNIYLIPSIFHRVTRGDFWNAHLPFLGVSSFAGFPCFSGQGLNSL